MGLAPEDAERVFDRFWRADPSRQRTIGGSGLGLSIALGDARLHGGTLAVWSELGVGTNFVLTIPRGTGVWEDSFPVPLEPTEALAAIGVATEPISLRDNRDAPVFQAEPWMGADLLSNGAHASRVRNGQTDPPEPRKSPGKKRNKKTATKKAES